MNFCHCCKKTNFDENKTIFDDCDNCENLKKICFRCATNFICYKHQHLTNFKKIAYLHYYK